MPTATATPSPASARTTPLQLLPPVVRLPIHNFIKKLFIENKKSSFYRGLFYFSNPERSEGSRCLKIISQSPFLLPYFSYLVCLFITRHNYYTSFINCPRAEFFFFTKITTIISKQPSSIKTITPPPIIQDLNFWFEKTNFCDVWV